MTKFEETKAGAGLHSETPVRIPSIRRIRCNTPNPAVDAINLISTRSTVEHELTPTETAGVAALARLVGSDPVGNPTAYAKRAAAVSTLLPVTVRHLLRSFRDEGNDIGILVFKNLPMESDACIPPTPTDNTQAKGSRTLLAACQAILSSAVTDMISYEAEGCGYLLQDMVPNPLLVDKQESQGSGVELEAHTEQGFSPMRPDYVTLAALRGDPAAKTFVFSARKLVKLMTGREVALLREPLWTTTIDSSFKPYIQDPDQTRGPWPILSGPVDDPTMLIDQDLQRGINAAAEKLLRKVIRLYIEHRDHHVLKAGEVLILDNNRAMHGRSRFIPKFDGTDRFIIRGFATRDLARSATARAAGSRQILAEYS